MAGSVSVDGRVVEKAGTLIATDAVITIKTPDIPYVSRGGLKLEKALHDFAVSATDAVCIDVGASTGGFTECLLQAGAKTVYAVDVGYGQLAWKLRNDPRVVVMERTNARHLQPTDFLEAPTLASMDVSFISIEKILPALRRIGVQTLVSLIKPQFEAGREQVGKKGIVRDPLVHEQVLRQVRDAALESGFFLKEIAYSPITGQNGNIEFLGYFVQDGVGVEVVSKKCIQALVKEAHSALLTVKQS